MRSIWQNETMVLAPLLAALLSLQSGTVVLREGVCIPPQSPGGRLAIPQDRLLASIAEGKVLRPKAGDAFAAASGTQQWQAVSANADGFFQGRPLGSGWLYARFDSSDEKPMVLRATGSGTVYLNGELRGGDPYGYGNLELPFLAKKGENGVLAQAARGRLKLEVFRAKADAFLSTADTTLPDIVIGSSEVLLAGVIVANATASSSQELTLWTQVAGGKRVENKLKPILPWSIRKQVLNIAPRGDESAGDTSLRLTLCRGREVLDQAVLSLQVMTPRQTRKVTFLSDIDESVQYYALNPAQHDRAGQGLVLTLHGASVEAIGQANAYVAKDGMHIVAPTNRRPFGFDWEGIGRRDALEVLKIAQKNLNTAKERTYLTGHSMGGHGTWHIGLSFPDRFAAIAPSAGWVSFFSYGGSRKPVQDAFLRSYNASETLSLLGNSKLRPIYVLHGDADDNVPVSEARTMVAALQPIHSMLQVHEEPKAGHWWGNQCVDWPPIFELFSKSQQPNPSEMNVFEFTTYNPSVTSELGWLRIVRQAIPLGFSSIKAERNGNNVRLSAENVSAFSIGGPGLASFGNVVQVSIEGQTINAPRPSSGWIDFEKVGGEWRTRIGFAANQKNHLRAGPIEEALQNGFCFVYGTRGTARENAMMLQKARADAENLLYRGNSSPDVFSDEEFLALRSESGWAERNVILLGNARINRAWDQTMESPIAVGQQEVRWGSRTEKRADLFSFQVRPRTGSDRALVLAIGWTGQSGFHLASRVPYFNSGVHYPDWFVGDLKCLDKGADSLLDAGFFDNDWRLQ